jgi:hypothetical protein
VATLDPLSLRVLQYLAGKYRPVTSDWVDAAEISIGLAAPIDAIEQACARLLGGGLIELSPADEENEHDAALITVKGLLALGLVP